MQAQQGAALPGSWQADARLRAVPGAGRGDACQRKAGGGAPLRSLDFMPVDSLLCMEAAQFHMLRVEFSI